MGWTGSSTSIIPQVTAGQTNNRPPERSVDDLTALFLFLNQSSTSQRRAAKLTNVTCALTKLANLTLVKCH